MREPRIAIDYAAPIALSAAPSDALRAIVCGKCSFVSELYCGPDGESIARCYAARLLRERGQ